MKTTLASLYVKATLCEKREEGSFEPCNDCESCDRLNNPNRKHPNVTEYRVTEASVFKDAVGDLIEVSKAAPILTDDLREDQLHRFIVIDEVQNASRQSIGPFLDSLEFSHPRVTIILISMDLSKMDPIVKDAIESRCIELSLQSISDRQIADNLIALYPSLAEGVAELVAYIAKGNMRKAWSTLEFFLTQYAPEELNTNIIYEQKFGGLSDVVRAELIDSIENRVWDETKSIINKFAAAEMMAVDMLLRDLTERELSIDGIKLVSALSNWYQCTYKAPLASMFMMFQGKSILKKDVILEVPHQTVKAVKSTPDDMFKMSKNLEEQLFGISGKKVKLTSAEDYPYLTFKTWREYMDYYAKDN